MTILIRCDKCGYEVDDSPKFIKDRTFREILPTNKYEKIKHICNKCDEVKK